ncbi:predicted protein [Coccidioides posadasii str. Silveira]|uniref:Predicted protein n=1 Tax=Coccidioides posadasii (strain RMSCC 757 / Silveira) TaxID=443226 RepID=E9D066_COCPS|nr:predicted protein [Coccidioides posadasii str. Silveira]
MILTNVTVLRTHTVSHSFSARKEGNEAVFTYWGGRELSDSPGGSIPAGWETACSGFQAKWWDGHTAEHWGVGRLPRTQLLPSSVANTSLSLCVSGARLAVSSPKLKRPESLSRDRYADPAGKLLWTLIGPPIIPPLDLPLLA